MHGRNQDHWYPWTIMLLVLTVCGCGGAHPQVSEEPAPAAEGASLFDPASAGTISGQVIWQGETPAVPPFAVRSSQLPEAVLKQHLIRENPNAPAIDPQSRGVGQAVVFLRGVAPGRCKPWDQPLVRVEQRDLRLHVYQGREDSHVGFVRRGDPVEMVSRDPVFHSLHAGGAAFFTLPFPDPDQPCTRRLMQPGIVALTSAAGYPWMRAYLFVDNHPYYTRTDAQGRFVLEQVPAGTYEVVCWLPNWLEERHERDPETGIVSRLFFKPAVEKTQRLTLGRAGLQKVRFLFSQEAFVH